MLVPRTSNVKDLHFQTEFLPVPDNHADKGFGAPCFRIIMGILLLEIDFSVTLSLYSMVCINSDFLLFNLQS